MLPVCESVPCLQRVRLSLTGGVGSPWSGTHPLPFILQYLPVESQLPASYLKTNRLRYPVCRDPDLLIPQAGFVGAQSGLVDIQLNSGDQLE